jgi:hypothetical protein
MVVFENFRIVPIIKRLFVTLLHGDASTDYPQTNLYYSMKKTLAIGSVNMILWAANTRGLDTSDILKSLRISPQSLQNPDERIEIAKVQTIWKAIVEKLGDRSLPLQMGEIISPISVGILAYVMMHAPNLGKSIEKLCQYQDIVCNAVETTFHQKGKLSLLTYELILRI